jgi:hypothetical protein
MTAFRIVRAVIVGVILTVLVGGNGIAGAQTTQTLKTDASSYNSGAQVTYAGTGWAGCDFTVYLGQTTLFAPLASGSPHANGSFTGTFTAPESPGTYTLVAKSAGQETLCMGAEVKFDVTESGSLSSTTAAGVARQPHGTTWER